MLPFMGDELLRGDQVKLVPTIREDMPEFARWAQDIEGQRLLRRGLVYPFTLQEIERWFSGERDEHFFSFSIRTLDDDQLVGQLAIKDVMWQARNCSFFILIGDKSDRGKGYGTDAVQVMLKYCFQEMNLYRVGLEVMEYNPAAIRSYKNAGFTEEGRLRHFVYRDGVYYDIVLMSILRQEWDKA